METFVNFLQDHRVERGCDFTHTSLGYPKGSYYVPCMQASRFHDLYCAAQEAGGTTYLTEKHSDIGPVVVDLDFKFTGCDQSRRYTRQHVETIVTTYADSMRSLLRLTYPLAAVIMEKVEPLLYNGGVKDGIHIMFPHVITPPTEQFIVRSEVLRALPPRLEQAGLVPANTWHSVIDDSVIAKNNWMMYGSQKPGGHAYRVTHVWQLQPREGGEGWDVVEECDPRPTDVRHWVPALSIRNKSHLTETLDHRRSEVFALDEQMAARTVQATARVSAPQTVAHRTSASSDDYDIARQLAGVLAVERAEAYDTWIKVGWCLYNIDERLLPEWEAFSRKSAKYTDGECANLWRSKMRKDSLGMGSLMMWAREDNPSQYYAVVREGLRHLIVKSSDSAAHHDVAKVVHAMFRHCYTCSNIRNKTWYEFKTHRWRPCDSAYTLRMHMSSEVYTEYLHVAAYFQQRAMASAEAFADDAPPSRVGRRDQGDSNHDLDRVKRINALAVKLKSVGFKEAVLRELQDMFYRGDFDEKLNSIPHLVGFENGVYDLERNVFRAGEPDDMISFSVGYDYVPYDATHAAIGEINDFFGKVFRVPSVRTYVLHTLASCLHGGIKYERYCIWHGEQGANGKSKLLDLVETALGDYAVKFPVSLLTQKRVASNAATSELARSKGRRFASMQEPGENEVLNIGLMKELSGNDKIVARHLFHEPIEFRPFYKMYMCCNQLPAVHSQDGGTWRRIRVVQFTSRFCENPDRNNPNEFQVDYELSNRFDAWKPHFMAMLIDLVPAVRAGIREPPEILGYTQNYRKENDSVAEYYENCVREVPDEPGVEPPVVTPTSLWNDYLVWRKRENINRNVKRGDFKCMIEKLMGAKTNSDNTGWAGYVVCIDGSDPSPSE